MRREQLALILWILGSLMSLYYYAPEMRLRQHWRSFWDTTKDDWACVWDDVKDAMRRFRIQVRLAADKVLGRSTSWSIRGAGGIATGEASTYGSATLVHPTDPEIAVPMLWAAVDDIRRQDEKHWTAHQDEHSQETLAERRVRHGSAWVGFVGFALVAVSVLVKGF